MDGRIGGRLAVAGRQWCSRPQNWLQSNQVIRLTESGIRIVFEPAGSTPLSQPKARDAAPVSTARGKVASSSRSGISSPRPSQPKPPLLPPGFGRTAEPVTPPWPPNQVDPRDPPVSAVEGAQRQRPTSLEQFGHSPVNAKPLPLPSIGDEPCCLAALLEPLPFLRRHHCRLL